METAKKKFLHELLHAIKKLAQKLNRNQYAYLSEEDIRSRLCSKLTRKNKSKIGLEDEQKCKRHTDAILTEARILDKNKKSNLIDILFYYTPKNKFIPIKFHDGKVTFFGKNNQCKRNIKNRIGKRILIEIKIGRKESRTSKKIIERIYSDVNKRKKLDFYRCYILYVDRENKLNDELKKQVKVLTRKNKKFRIIYLGCARKGKKLTKYLFYKGKLTKELSER